MGTTQLGWPAARYSAVRFFALTLSVATAIVALSPRSAWAGDPRKARDRIVELNKQALLSYEAKDFETARDLLTKALKEAKAAGLEEDKMTARTYLHLGAVYWVGFQDQAVAIQNFSLSKRIRPDIQLTPSIETADLKSVFDLATVESEPAPVSAPPPSRPATTSRPSRPLPSEDSSLSGDSGGEPDLPTSFPSPLMCTVPPEVPPNREQTLRCALKPGLNAKVVQIHYRAPGVEAYQTLGMRKTSKGWYMVTLPSSAMKAGSLQVYFDARDASDNEVASNGQVDSPSIIEVRRKGGGGGGGRGREDVLKGIRDQAERERYESGLHRRREGAIWFGVGGGLGWGYVPAGKLEWDSAVKVSAMTTVAGLFHIVPEVGYMWSDDFAIAAQLRLELIKQEQATYRDPDTGEMQTLSANYISGAPTTMAAAGFLRAIWYMDLSASGNFRLSYSADVGGGFIRFPVKPTADVQTDPNTGEPIIDRDNTIPKTDTRPVGIFLAGGSGGLVWHLSRHFALALEARCLFGAPSFGAVIEGALSAQLAFGGVKGPAAPSDGEEEEEEGAMPGLDEPGSGGGYEEEAPVEDYAPEE